MEFTVRVTPQPRWMRVQVEGEAGVGNLLSLLQVLAVDSRAWTQGGVLLDLRALDAPLPDDAQAQVATAAARTFAGLGRVALLTPPGTTREAGGVRAFDDEAAAQAWLDDA